VGLVLVAVASAIILGVVFGLDGSNGKPDRMESTATSSASSTVQENALVAATESKPAAAANKQEYFTSPGPLDARVRAVSPSIINGYDTCTDLEYDIIEALKLYVNNYINEQTVSAEMYAQCDPDNDNWYYDLYDYDYYYHDYNTTQTNVTKQTRAIPTSSKKTRDGSLPKQTRSSVQGLKKKTRTRGPDDHPESGNKNVKSGSEKSGDTRDGFGQNSQIEGVNEIDKVVSDGEYIYAAYGDVLYAWPADDMTNGMSITRMPGDANDCDWNTTVPCTSSTKPSIQALFLGSGNSRLTVVVTQSIWEYNALSDQIQPVISDYGSNIEVRVYDVSDVTPGSPLKELGHKALSGSLLDGSSTGDMTFIATTNYIDTSALTKNISRSEPQYCGLNATSYKELAAKTAQNLQIESFAKQMVTELELVNDCSRIFQVSTLQDSSSTDVSDLTVVDFLLGSFIQVFSFDSSSIDTNGDIPTSVAGSFTAGNGYSIYLTDDFLAFPSNVYKYNDTSMESISETFILGFDLSSNDGAIPFCYGHIPGDLDSKYRIDKSDSHLRILTNEYKDTDEVTWTSTFDRKVYVLEIPTTPGHMILAGKSEDLLDEDSYYIGASLFSEDKVYVFGDEYGDKKNEFAVVDLSNDLDPSVIGSLKVDYSLSYMHRIEINSIPHILGLGYETNYTTWDSLMVLSLIDVSTPSQPKQTASYKESGASTESGYDFLSIRYLDSNKLIIPLANTTYNESGMVSSYSEGFAVFDVSATAITPAFVVTHSTENSYCWYDAMVPPRSFLIQSELTTIEGHTAINTDIQTGSFISKLDLDVGFNYSVCESWWYNYDYGYSYDDDVGNSTVV
jgi:DNA excision repair protein ERCC-4